MTLAEEGPKPPRNRRTGRRYLNANRHRYLIKCRQKDKYPQELYIFANSIPSGSDGACIADWFLGVDAYRSVSVYPYGRSQERCYCESVFLREGVGMDAIYLLILVGLYLTTNGLVWALSRLGKTP
jgi:hypothetical protein